MMRLTALLCLLATCMLCGCPRAYPEGVEQPQSSGTHPWDGPTYAGVELDRTEQARERRRPLVQEEQVQPLAGRGPKLPAEDTLDMDQLPGQYLIIASVVNEEVLLRPPSEQGRIDLQSNGTMLYHVIMNWQSQTNEGSWTKLGPGVLGLRVGMGDYTEMHGQFVGGKFLYLWAPNEKNALWMVRIPSEVSERIEANRFSTNRGELVLNNVVSQSFSGQVVGDRPMTVHGFYNRGILSMYWEEADRSAAGYAAFVVSPDWSTLDGMWWVDNWETAPFGGPWTGRAIAGGTSGELTEAAVPAAVPVTE